MDSGPSTNRGGGRGRSGGGGRGRFFRGRGRWNNYNRRGGGRQRKTVSENDGSTAGPSGNRQRAPKRASDYSNHYNRGDNDNDRDDDNNSGDMNQQFNNENNSGGDRPPRQKRTRTETLIAKNYEQKYPGFRRYFPFPSVPDYDVLNWEAKFDIATTYLKKLLVLVDGNKKSDEVLKKIIENEYLDIEYSSLLSMPKAPATPFDNRAPHRDISIISTEDLIEAQSNESIIEDGWKEFENDFINHPREVLNTFGLAVFKLTFDAINRWEASANNGDDEEEILPSSPLNPFDMAFIRVGILKKDPLTKLTDIGDCVDKLVTIKGAIIRQGTTKKQVLWMVYRCLQCSLQFSVYQPGGLKTLPKKCLNEDCGNKRKENFETMTDSKYNRLVDHKIIKLQEVDYDEIEFGTIPETINCHLSHDLVNACTVGENVTLCGIIQLEPRKLADVKRTEYLLVTAVKNHKDSDRTAGGHSFCLTNKDYYMIREVFDTEDRFRLLVASLAPNIIGHEMVKAGLLLSIFGGTPSFEQDGDEESRQDIHVLIVGDPGMGKSQMLKKVSEASPRGVYVSGSGTTKAGLTVSVYKDGDDYSLDAGALVMADTGICCIDEFDKMESQHNALLETMEQQSISISKCGMYRNVPARATVVAAANPVGGHYDKTKTVSSNINMSPALLSRFDLIYVLQDTPHSTMDDRIMQHILGPQFSLGNSRGEEDDEYDGTLSDLERYLRVKVPQNFLLPHQQLRKYIAYAKEWVHPRLSEEAGDIIKDYYIFLRTHHRNAGSTPVTMRQLESLMRLAEARAKCELREEVTRKDAEDIVDIFRFCTKETFDNDAEIVLGFSQEIMDTSSYADLSLNLSISSRSSQRDLGRSSKKIQMKGLHEMMVKLADRSSKKLFTEEEIKFEAQKIGILAKSDQIIDALNIEGAFLKKGPRLYEVTGTSF